LTVHSSAASEACRSFRIVVSAVVTTRTSRITMNDPMEASPSTHRWAEVIVDFVMIPFSSLVIT
jgi:hypothetical protein